MYQADIDNNTNYRTNESFTQEFTRSCLGRILIFGVIILVGMLVAYFTAPKEEDMNEEMTDNLMQCLEVNDGIKGDVVDDYVHNLTFIFTTADTTVIPQDDLEIFHKYNRLVSYRHTFYSTSYLHMLEVGTIHKGYEQRLNQPEVKEPEEVDLGQTPEITEFHYKGNEHD